MSAAAHVRAPLSLVLSLILFAGGAGTAFGQGVTAFAQPSAWEGPPLTLTEALREGLERNASLGLARARVAPLAYRSAQERSLVPPRIEAQIWQLPITTLNLAQADMYMFMLEQEFPGPGKRGLRAANAERELAVASAEFETQRLGMAGEIRRAYVTLALARRREAAAAAVAAAESRVLVMVAEAAARVDAASARLGVLRSALVPQAEHLVEATRLAFANAQGSMGDALEAQLLLLQAQLDEARAIRELELARADLSTAVGEEPLAPSTRGLTETSSSRVTDGPSGPGPLHGTPTRIPAGFQRNEREPSTQN
jgi:outer membrane protein TolC